MVEGQANIVLPIQQSRPQHEITAIERLGQYDEDPHIQHFLRWAATPNTLSSGCRGIANEEDCSYIAYNNKLRAYFNEPHRIMNLLKALFPQKDMGQLPNVRTIKERYLRVFSILIRIHQGRFIDYFVHYESLDDDHLPLDSQPFSWPESTDTAFFKRFEDMQWYFFPASFRVGDVIHFSKNRILPITKEWLGEGGSAVINKVILDDEYNELSKEQNRISGKSKTNVFVVKTYRTQDAEKYFTNECEAFRRLMRNSGTSRNVIGFYGSFRHDQSLNVVLEYADRGTLEALLETSQPSQGEDIISFWEGLLEVAQGLWAIHYTQERSSDGLQMFNGWHQDVKPSNILLCSLGSGSRYHFRVKLADLGTTHFRKCEDSAFQARATATWGTFTYGAPECDSFQIIRRGCPNLIEQSVDIWSLGCVYSVAATWIGFDCHMVREYAKRRRAEIKKASNYSDGDWFHNGTEVLQTVKTHHENIIRDLRPKDYVTKEILLTLVTNMLQKPQGRMSLLNINFHSRQIIENAKTKLTNWGVKSNPSRSQTQSTHDSGSDSDSHPSLNYDSQSDQLRRSWDSRSQKQKLFANQKVSPSPSLELTSHWQSPGTSRHQRFSDHSGPWSSMQNHNQLPRADQSLQKFRRKEVVRFPTATNNTSIIDQTSASNGMTFEAEGLSNSQFTNGLAKQYAEGSLKLNKSLSSRRIEKMRNGSLTNRDANYAGGNCAATTMTPILHFPPALTIPPPQFPQQATPQNALQINYQAPYRESVMQERHPELSVAAGLEWKRAKESGRVVTPLEKGLLELLAGRDHVFLIDNAPSMFWYKQEIRDRVELLSYILKACDPDGLDLYFTTTAAKLRPKTIPAMLKALDDNLPGSAKGEIPDMRYRFSAIIEEYQNKLGERHYLSSLFKRSQPRRGPRKLSLYVFTDGLWQPKCDLTVTIKTLVSLLEQYSLTAKQVGVQFIRFGESQTGINRLEKLDSGLNLTLDIVDHTAANDNVWKMLLGSINDWFDND